MKNALINEIENLNINIDKVKELTNKLKNTSYDDEFVFHYTSVSSLFSIVESEEFWLCNLYNSNDPEEGQMPFLEFKKGLFNYWERFRNKDVYENKYLIESVLKYTEDNEVIPTRYGISFTSEEDKLAHWQRYAGLDGVCLKINLKKLKYLFHGPETITYFKNILSFDTIEYSNKICYKEVLDNVIDFFAKLELFSKTFTIDNSELTKEMKFSFYRKCLKSLFLDYISTHKKETFDDEKEIRLSLGDDFMDFFNDFKKDDNIYKILLLILSYSHLDEKHFFVKNNNIKSYYSLNIADALHDGLIETIILGPNSHQNIDDLKKFLDSKKLKISIKQSSIKINS